MPPQADAATLNVQPRQRREVYEGLAMLATATSFKNLRGEFDMPESELRDALRKLDTAGLARRTKGTWSAVPLETAELESRGAREADAPSRPQD
jgi:hypothetical protein